MEKVVVVLADTDEKYLMPLELKFIEEFKDNADMNVITDRDYFNTYFSVPREIDILIINENLYTVDIKRHNIASLFILTESNDVSNEGEPFSNLIYKYTSVKEIFRRVINASTKDVLSTMGNKEKTQVIMVYSPCGGVGKSTVSLGICAALAGFHKRVLYVNTETIQSYNYMLGNKEYCPGEFEKLLASKKENIVDCLKGAVGFEKFDYILPFKYSASSLNINTKEFKHLVEAVKQAEMYDYIVLDSSSDFTLEKTMMMSFSDKVVIITAQDRVSCLKLEYFLNNIDCSDKNKFIFICNKYLPDRENWLIKGNLVGRCLVSEYIDEFGSDPDSVNVEYLSTNKQLQKLAYTFI
ncbi:MAG TPA: AAA family ATPase [Acetivibrio sp.]|nr:AAA family ATPase [Acetivibrio sp.]